MLEGVLGGGTNKLIAKRMGISPRTVDVHRERLMERPGTETPSQLLEIAATAGLRPSD